MALTLNPLTQTGNAVDLVTLAQVQTALPRLSAAQLADAPAVITAVSRAFEAFCRRPLALQSFDEVYRPGRTRKIYLKTWPVAVVSRLKTDWTVVCNVWNTDNTTNQVALVQRTPTQLILTRIAAGQSTPATLTLADYTTIAQLVAAVQALGHGWTAQASAGFESWAVSELNNDYETQGALVQQAELRIYKTDLLRWTLDTNTGVIELTENRAEAFRFADRAWGIGYGFSWSAASEPRHAGVRAIYRAGYATQPADLAAGYTPVPDHVTRAAIMAVSETLNLTPSSNVQSESRGNYSYSLGGPPVVLSRAVKSLLAAEVSKRLPGP